MHHDERMAVTADPRAEREVVALCQALIRIDTTNPPGQETPAALLLREHLEDAGVECELVARQDDRANLVARIRGTSEGPSLAFVGHTDVVPTAGQDWSRPPFGGVVEDRWLFGRGALDMKGELAARAVAMARLAREGFRPRGDLWLLAVADEEDGSADVGMRWLLEARPDIRPDFALNEGEGTRLELADGRTVLCIAVGEKGTCPVRVTALGEAGHGSMPDQGRNAVPLLAELLRRIGTGMPRAQRHPVVDRMLEVLVGPVDDGGYADAVAEAARLHPALHHLVPAVAGTTMAPTMLSGSVKRNVLPARASVELDCRILPGTSADDAEREVRARLGDDLPYALDRPEPLVAGSSSPAEGPLFDACAQFVAAHDPGTVLLPVLCTGFTDSVHLRAAAGTVAYGISPLLSTPPEVALAGYHNRDERVHVDDLTLGVAFHEHVARALLG